MNKKNILKLTITVILGLSLGYWLALKVIPYWQPEKVLPPAKKVSEMTRPGKIEVKFESLTASIGQQVKADIFLDTGGKTINGFDIILAFDPQAWEILSERIQLEPTIPFSCPLNQVDGQKGQIRLSGLTEFEKDFAGKVLAGSLLLRPRKVGLLELKVVFEGPGATTDSNLAQSFTAEDILGEVIDGKINVQ